MEVHAPGNVCEVLGSARPEVAAGREEPVYRLEPKMLGSALAGDSEMTGWLGAVVI